MFHLCCIKVITATQAYGGLVCVDIYIYAFVCICLTCHQCFTSASPVFHQYFTSVVPVFHKCLTTVVPVFHQYFTSASSVLCQWFISVSPVSQMSSKYFIRQNNHGIRFYSTPKCICNNLTLTLSRTGGVFPSTARGGGQFDPHFFNSFLGACKAYLVQYYLRHF